MKLGKCLKEVLLFFSGVGVGYFCYHMKDKKISDCAREMSDKNFRQFMLMNRWVQIRQEGNTVADFLRDRGYKEIAVYGISHVGKTLLNELAGSDIKVKYCIDKKAKGVYSETIPMLCPDEELPEADAIIVTVGFYFDEIKNNLSPKVNCPIILLEDILYDR